MTGRNRDAVVPAALVPPSHGPVTPICESAGHLCTLAVGFNDTIITLDVIIIVWYIIGMIVSYRCKETQKIFNRQYSRKLPLDIQKVAMRKLWQIDAATIIEDLRIPPGNHLEALKGNRKGQHSIRINQQYRICFQWQGNNAHLVGIVDYHKE
jgi:toxin HigB-1